MEDLRGWVMSVVAVGMLVSIAQGLSPGGGVGRVSRLCGGLLLFLALVTPLTRLDLTGALSDFHAYCDRLSEPDRPFAETSAALTRELVTARAEAAIRDRGEELGEDVSVAVTCGTRDGLPVPAEVTLTGSLTGKQREALTEWIGESFALPRERIHFQTEETKKNP